MASWWYVVSAERKAAKIDGGHGSAGLSVPHGGRQHALAGFLRRREFGRIRLRLADRVDPVRADDRPRLDDGRSMPVASEQLLLLPAGTSGRRSSTTTTSGGSEGTSIAVQRLDPASGQVADVGVTCDG